MYVRSVKIFSSFIRLIYTPYAQQVQSFISILIYTKMLLRNSI